MVPALVITILCGFVGNKFITADYQGFWENDLQLINYIATFFMLQDAWSINLTPPNNGPFWSITFEAAYYILFGCLFFIKRLLLKCLLVLIIGILFGLTVMYLFPVWLFGYYAFFIHHSRFILNEKLSIFIFFLV